MGRFLKLCLNVWIWPGCNNVQLWTHPIHRTPLSNQRKCASWVKQPVEGEEYDLRNWLYHSTHAITYNGTSTSRAAVRWERMFPGRNRGTRSAIRMSFDLCSKRNGQKPSDWSRGFLDYWVMLVGGWKAAMPPSSGLRFVIMERCPLYCCLPREVLNV
jgi:hypothetical protein